MQYKLVAAALYLQGSFTSAAVHRRHGHARREAEAMQYDNPNWAAEQDWTAICATVGCNGPPTAQTGAPAAASSAIQTAAPVVNAAVAQITSASTFSPSSSSASAPASSSSSTGSGLTNAITNVGNSVKTGGFKLANFVGQSSGGYIAGPASAPWENVAEFGSPPGSNIAQITDDPSNYQFTNTFTNSMSSTRTIWLWNKSGINSSGQKDAMIGQSQQPAVKFTLAPGQSASYSFMGDTVGGGCDITDSSPQTTQAGAPNCAYVEWNFNAHGGASSYDVSLIPTNNYAGHGACSVSVSGPSGTSSCSNTPFQGPGDEYKGVPTNPQGPQVNLLTTFGGS